jgi:hypothetical protein
MASASTTAYAALVLLSTTPTSLAATMLDKSARIYNNIIEPRKSLRLVDKPQVTCRSACSEGVKNSEKAKMSLGIS